MTLPDEILAKIAEVEASEPSGPNRLAAICGVMIPHLLAMRDAATDKRERNVYSRRLKTNRMLLKWAKSRAGYVS